MAWLQCTFFHKALQKVPPVWPGMEGGMILLDNEGQYVMCDDLGIGQQVGG